MNLIALAIKYRNIAFAATAIACALFFGLWRYEALNHKATSEALKTAKTAIETHEKNILISERTNHAYQNDLDRLNADVKRLRSRPPECVTITAPSGIPSQEGQGRGHGSQDGSGRGVRSDWLYDYAIEAETLRIERNACKDFVNEVWER